MSTAAAGWIFVLSLVVALVLVHKPFGDLMHRAVTGPKHYAPERAFYRLVGVDRDGDQTWGVYLRSVLAFSAVSVVLLYGIVRVNQAPAQAWNTAVSFVTNTNWQSYSGESLRYSVQMAGLAVQNFVSAAVGIAVALAVIRGFSRSATDRLGNFWVDLARITFRILLPISFVAALVLVAGGVVQNFSHDTLGGPVASQEVIKLLGTNGGGFYNANSAHPYENPTAWTNWLQIFLIFLIPFSLPRVFGRMVGDKRQGYAIAAVMAVLAISSVVLLNWAQLSGSGAVPQAAGAASEGIETRFGIPQSATFAAATTLTSTGAVNSFHDSYTPLGGGLTMLDMMLGEIAPGGVGSGLYGMLVIAIITVFVAGLMVGRTPEYLGKKIGTREITFASLYFLVTPAILLIGTASAMALKGARASMLNTGPHGLSEVLYAYTSAANNNGSAFAGISVNTDWYNTSLGVAMLLGRFLPMVFVLALAGSLAKQTPVPASAGTLPTHRPLFVSLVGGVAIVLVALTFLPALALGPLAEGVH